MSVTTKTCRKCGQELSLSEFNKQKARPDGLFPWCRGCNSRHWDERNPRRIECRHKREEAKRLLVAEGKKKCGRCGEVKPLTEFRTHPLAVDGHRKECKNCSREIERELYNKRHPENKEQRERRWQDKQDAWFFHLYELKYCPKCGEWKAKTEFDEGRSDMKFGVACHCRECECLRLEEYSKTSRGRENRRQRQARRLARKRDIRCDLTNEQWQVICEFFGYRCAYCGEQVKKLHQEHVIPLSKGGEYAATNIVPACPSCNAKKHDADWRKWMLAQGLDWQSFQDKWHIIRMEVT